MERYLLKRRATFLPAVNIMEVSVENTFSILRTFVYRCQVVFYILHLCFSVTNISEPIYENVPLPWPHPLDNGVAESRSRASSIQSAPEINSVTSAAAASNDRSTSAAIATVAEESKNTNVNKRGNEMKNTFSSPSSTVSSSSRLTSANHSVSTSIGENFVP